MKRNVLIILSFLLVGTLFCQEKNIVIELKLDPSFSNSINYRSSEYISVFNNEPTFVLGYGISVYYDLNDRLSIGTGIIDSKKGYLVHGWTIDTLGNREDGIVTINNIFEYIEVPIKLRYEFLTNENVLKPYLSFSFSNQFIIKQIYKFDYSADWSTLEWEDHEISGYNKLIDDGFRTYYLSIGLGAGVKYNITDRLLLRLEPKIDYSLFSLYKNEDALKFNLYNVGVDFLMGYSF